MRLYQNRVSPTRPHLQVHLTSKNPQHSSTTTTHFIHSQDGARNRRSSSNHDFFITKSINSRSSPHRDDRPRLHFLPKLDLSNFRLTCKVVAEVGAKYIVRELHAIFTAKSFQNLLSIANHPTLCKCICSIFYEVRFLRIVEKESYFRSMFHTTHFRALERDSNFDEVSAKVKESWIGYKRLFREQRQMTKQRHDFTVFSEALPRFLALKLIHVDSFDGTESEKLQRAYENTGAVYALMLHSGQDFWGQNTGTRALASLLRAAEESSSPIQELYVALCIGLSSTKLS